MTMYQKRFILALLVIIGCFAYVFIVTLYPDAKQNDIILGALLSGGFATIINFFFGSSDRKGKSDEAPKL